MDEKLRKAKRNFEQTQDLESAQQYIRLLEQYRPVKMPHAKVQNTDKTMPCIICEKQLDQEGSKHEEEHKWVREHEEGRFWIANTWQGVAIRTSGNYGSQVLDMHTVFFYICDECIIRNSHKMLHYGENSEGRDDIKNAREYYEAWVAALEENQVENVVDTYYETIRKYFE